MVNVKEHTRGGAKIAAHSRTPPGSIVGGEFVAPNATPQARHFILMARAAMYSKRLAPALHRVVAGSAHLSDGAVPFIAKLVVQLAHAARVPLNDVEIHTVVAHLAISIVQLALKMGRPSVKQDERAQTHDIIEGVMAVLSGKVSQMVQQSQAMQGGQQGGPQAPPVPPPQGGPLLASAANG